MTTAQNTAVDVSKLTEMTGRKIKFEFNDESPVTGVLEGVSGKIGMIRVGKEKEGILVNEIVKVTDYGVVDAQTAPEQKADKPKAAPKKTTKKAAPKQTESKGGLTKRQQAEQLVDEKQPATRKEAIELFMSELDMSKAGASTYWANIKKSRQG